MTTTERLGVCNLCEAICGLVLTVEDNRVTAVRGNPDDPLSRGHVCPKGVSLPDLHDDPDRLRRPVKKVDGAWVEIGWDEAIGLVVDNVARIQRRDGREALAVYLGNPNVHSLGAMTHGTAMVKALGTPNSYSATSVDQLPHQLVAHLMYGHQLLIPIPDIDATSYFLVVGGNPMASNGSLMTVPDFPARRRGLKARGGRMVVVDPRRTETAKVADEHLFVRPGTDAFFLLALANVLLADGLARPAGYVDGLDVVAEAVAPFTPERAAEHTGIAADDVRRIAHELADADGACVYGRVGVSMQEFGTLSQWAIQLVNILTGNLDSPGGALLTSPAIDIIGKGLIGRGHLGRWKSRVRGLPEFGGELPVSALAEEIRTPGKGQVKALLTVAGNPVLSTPDGAGLGEAIEGLEFMAAIDFYLNETTRHADVVLPPRSALERDHYDLAFHTLAVRNTARFTPAVLEPEEGTRTDWQIFRDVALGVVAKRGGRRGVLKRVALEARLRTSPTVLVDLLLRTAKPRLSVRALRRSPHGVDLGPLRPSLPGRLMTRDHRVHAAPDVVLADLARLDAVAPVADGQLVLIGRRHQRDNNSWGHNTARLTKGRARHHLLMHPEDLAARGLADGACVRVTSRVGSVEVEVRATDDVMRGVVSLPHGYGHARSDVEPGRLGHAAGVPGVSINDLTDPERVDVSGNAVLNGVPVQVQAASA